MLPRLRQPKDCACSDRQAQILGAFDILTQPIPPTLPDVLSCLVADCLGVRDGQTFEEWAREFGYDIDSRTAEKVYRGCVEEWQALIRLGDDLDELEELFRDF